MLNMPGFQPEYEMAVEIIGIERCRRVVIKHYQIIVAMTFEIVVDQVPHVNPFLRQRDNESFLASAD